MLNEHNISSGKEGEVNAFSKAMQNLWVRSHIHENTSMLISLAHKSSEEAGNHFLFDMHRNHKELICFDEPDTYVTKDMTNQMRRANLVDDKKLFSLVAIVNSTF